MSKLYEEQFEKVIEHYTGTLSTIRTGRANPAILDDVSVQCYGSQMKLKELAAINVPEPKVLQIEPWDKNVVKDIEKALLASNIGLTPNVSGTVIRLVLPPLTEDRRKLLVKQLVDLTEQARVAVRKNRDDLLKGFKSKKGDGSMTEDEFFQESKDVQAIVDRTNARIKELAETKEKEMMTV